jgi:excisionase family DNA binding protein
MEERPFTVREVEALTGLRERTVRAMIADGRLRAIRLANVRAVRVPVEAVRALLGNASITTSTDGA